MENQIYYISKIEYERLSFNATDNLFIISGAGYIFKNEVKEATKTKAPQKRGRPKKAK